MESKNLTDFHPWYFSKTPKEQRLWLRFSSATPILSFMFGSTRSPKMVSLKGWFSMICLLLGGHMFHSTFLPKNGTTCYPSIKSIAQQPLIFAHREGFPRLCGPNFAQMFATQKNGVPRSCWAITFPAIPWIFIYRKEIYTLFCFLDFYHYFLKRKNPTKNNITPSPSVPCLYHWTLRRFQAMVDPCLFL